MKNKDLKRTLGLILFLAIPVIIGLVIGIVLGKTVFSKSSNTSNNQTNTLVEITDKNLKEKLLKVVDNNGLEKIVYKYRSNKVEFNDLTNDEKLYLAGIDSYYKKSGDWVSFDTLKDNLNKAYGSNFNITSNDYNYHDISTIVFKDGNYFYILLAARKLDAKGRILMYKSIDLLHWEFVSDILEEGSRGKMIECPDFIKDLGLLTYCEQEQPSDGYKHLNTNQLIIDMVNLKTTNSSQTIMIFWTMDLIFMLLKQLNKINILLVGWKCGEGLIQAQNMSLLVN